MKKLLLVLSGVCLFVICNAQTTPGPAENKLTAALCDCISKIDQSKITTKKEADKAFMDCFMAQSDMLVDVAAERGVEMTDNEGMNKLGRNIGVDLMKQKCEGFLTLAVKMASKAGGDNATETASTTGTFKRIDLKGFNYIILTDGSGSERSFLWLTQFPGSERFMVTPLNLAGKKLKITWEEIEVYLPAAKGYYKVKQIKAADIL